MRRLSFAIVAYAFFVAGVFADDQAATQDAVTQPVYALFDAMREHDGEGLLQQFTSEALLHRAKVDGSIQVSDLHKFAEFVGNSTKYLDEHLLSVTVHQQDNLASVWTPYVFYLDKQLSHCGVNSFQLVLQENRWKIQYLIDNTYQGDCEAFIAHHSEPKTAQ